MTDILLVEDNEMNRDMLSRRLQRHGYEVRIAENGAQAIDKATAEPPDLILMDLSLPVMDGWEATERLRGEAHTAEVPIIALTAHAREKDEEGALAAGCNGFETKPVDIRRLVDTIEQHL
jgi:CheY-like chemotaxis protein